MPGRRMPTKLRWSILKRDGFRCTYCGRTANQGAELHVDHILSWADGGTDDPANLTTACSDCNLGKHDESLPGIEFDVKVGEFCPSRTYVAFLGVFMYDFNSYAYTLKFCQRAFTGERWTSPPRDRRDNQVWTMMKAYHAEWQAAVTQEPAA